MTFVQNKDGVFSEYDDDYEIVIHCETEEEQKKIIEHLKSISWIPASADVMIWTVMNMRRSAKNMRLIDADKIIDSLGISDIDFAIGAVIDEQPTVFDLDKVMGQLEELKSVEQDDSVAEIISTIIWNKAIQKSIGIVKGGGVE